jgi:hypothetical protein
MVPPSCLGEVMYPQMESYFHLYFYAILGVYFLWQLCCFSVIFCIPVWDIHPVKNGQPERLQVKRLRIEGSRHAVDSVVILTLHQGWLPSTGSTPGLYYSGLPVSLSMPVFQTNWNKKFGTMNTSSSALYFPVLLLKSISKSVSQPPIKMLHLYSWSLVKKPVRLICLSANVMVFYYKTSLKGHELCISNFMQFDIKKCISDLLRKTGWNWEKKKIQKNSKKSLKILKYCFIL